MRTRFRLVVAGVHPDAAGTLERALLRFVAVEWVGFDYAPGVETLFVDGVLPCGIARAVEVYLPQLSYCAWDIVCDDLTEAPARRRPEVLLILNPNERDEQSQSLNARHFGQYKRRRRQFEACGGKVLDRWV